MNGDVEALPAPPIYRLQRSVSGVPKFIPYNSERNQRFRTIVKLKHFESVRLFFEDTKSLVYFQVPDIPSQSNPMFHRNAVLYLTPVGIAIFYQQLDVLRHLIKLLDSNKIARELVNPNRVCFATNVAVKKTAFSDIQEFTPFCLSVRCETWGAIPCLLQAGWCPHEPFKLCARRIFSKFNIYYSDFLDYALAQLSSRPGISIALLIHALYTAYNDNFDLYAFTSDANGDHIGGTIARRMLRYCHYVDKSFRNVSQVLNAIRVLVNMQFFESISSSIESVNPIMRLNYIQSNPVINENSRPIFDQDGCISLLLSIVSTAKHKGLTNIANKSTFLLAKVIISTRWVVSFFTYEAPVLLSYFSHLEATSCDLSVFIDARNAIINLLETEIGDWVGDILYYFKIDTVDQLTTTMHDYARGLNKCDMLLIKGNIKAQNVLNDALNSCDGTANFDDVQGKVKKSRNPKSHGGDTSTKSDNSKSKMSSKQFDNMEVLDESASNSSSSLVFTNKISYLPSPKLKSKSSSVGPSKSDRHTFSVVHTKTTSSSYQKPPTNSSKGSSLIPISLPEGSSMKPYSSVKDSNITTSKQAAISSDKNDGTMERSEIGILTRSSSGNVVTTRASSGNVVTTRASNGNVVTTRAFSETGATTRAFSETGATTRALSDKHVISDTMSDKRAVSDTLSDKRVTSGTSSEKLLVSKGLSDKLTSSKASKSSAKISTNLKSIVNEDDDDISGSPEVCEEEEESAETSKAGKDPKVNPSFGQNEEDTNDSNSVATLEHVASQRKSRKESHVATPSMQSSFKSLLSCLPCFKNKEKTHENLRRNENEGQSIKTKKQSLASLTESLASNSRHTKSNKIDSPDEDELDAEEEEDEEEIRNNTKHSDSKRSQSCEDVERGSDEEEDETEDESEAMTISETTPLKIKNKA